MRSHCRVGLLARFFVHIVHTCKCSQWMDVKHYGSAVPFLDISTSTRLPLVDGESRRSDVSPDANHRSKDNLQQKLQNLTTRNGREELE